MITMILSGSNTFPMLGISFWIYDLQAIGLTCPKVLQAKNKRKSDK